MTREEKDWEIGIVRGIERGIQIFLQSGEDTITLSADVETAKMLAAALRGPEPDPDTGIMRCDYCTDTFDQKPLLQENKYKPYTRMMSTISIEEYNGKHQIEIDLWDGGNVYAAFEINYCPMCGRKLEVEE